MDAIPIEDIVDLAKKMSTYKRIVFLGFTFSMGILISLQGAFKENGIHVYTLCDSMGQENMLSRVKQDDLVIVVSIKERWFSSIESQSTIHKFKQVKCHKMLWTLVNNHLDKDIFDDVFVFGRNVNRFGYTQLMTFVPILTNYYMKMNNCVNHII